MSQTAVDFKNQGNKAFSAGDWPTAIDFYSKAIDTDASEATFFTNRAQVRKTPPWFALRKPCD
jgi:serine/threonine-protein phosphatase 5